jgi:peptidoglycan/LPS O-acetylase OafA/YrhL
VTGAPGRYRSLQILRALAAWMVVYHHVVQFYVGAP